MIKVAITGNIASGKSQVEDLLRSSYPVYDGDILAHEVLEQKTTEIIKAFEDYDISDNGMISRSKLANIVFDYKQQKTKLENLIYPVLIEKFNEIFDNTKADFVFISASQLYEANMQTLFDKVIFIYADDNIRLKRLMARNNLSESNALKRINAQEKQEIKASKANYIITNNTTLDELETQVKSVLEHLHKS